jgi:hypothetical protein
VPILPHASGRPRGARVSAKLPAQCHCACCQHGLGVGDGELGEVIVKGVEDDGEVAGKVA